MDLQAGIVDEAILKSELEVSYQNELTQPTFLQHKTPSDVKEFERTLKSEYTTESLVRTVSVTYLFLKAYLHQLGIVLLTGVIAVLACALRGMTSYSIDQQKKSHKDAKPATCTMSGS